MRIRCCRTALLAILVAVVAAPTCSLAQEAGAGGVPKDVKGWRDIEWGAAPDQVAASIGKPLGEPRKGEDGRTYYRVMDFPVGAWITNLVPVFSGSDHLGLVSVTLNFRKRDSFQQVADELTRKLGPATSRTSEYLKDSRTKIEEASWLFPTTEITCRWRGEWGIVVYLPRSKSPS